MRLSAVSGCRFTFWGGGKEMAGGIPETLPRRSSPGRRDDGEDAGNGLVEAAPLFHGDSLLGIEFYGAGMKGNGRPGGDGLQID